MAHICENDMIQIKDMFQIVVRSSIQHRRVSIDISVKQYTYLEDSGSVVVSHEKNVSWFPCRSRLDHPDLDPWHGVADEPGLTGLDLDGVREDHAQLRLAVTLQKLLASDFTPLFHHLLQTRKS